jgi:hypothetical protein
LIVRTLNLQRVERRRASAVRVKMVLKLALGWALVPVGLVLFMLPLPLGLPVLAVALGILIVESAAARRMLARVCARSPRLTRLLDGCAHRLPMPLRLSLQAVLAAAPSAARNRRSWFLRR